MTATVDGIPFRRQLPPLTGSVLALIDGRRTVGEIHAGISGATSSLSWETFHTDFTALFAALNGLGKMHLRVPDR
jgi:hypothetical protein